MPKENQIGVSFGGAVVRTVQPGRRMGREHCAGIPTGGLWRVAVSKARQARGGWSSLRTRTLRPGDFAAGKPPGLLRGEA